MVSNGFNSSKQLKHLKTESFSNFRGEDEHIWTTTQFTVADSGKMFYPYQGRIEAALTQGKIMNFPEKLDFFVSCFVKIVPGFNYQPANQLFEGWDEPTLHYQSQFWSFNGVHMKALDIKYLCECYLNFLGGLAKGHPIIDYEWLWYIHWFIWCPVYWGNPFWFIHLLSSLGSIVFPTFHQPFAGWRWLFNGFYVFCWTPKFECKTPCLRPCSSNFFCTSGALNSDVFTGTSWTQ